MTYTSESEARASGPQAQALTTLDHGIDLKETFVPKVAKSYPMNPKEMEACKAFIDEHLKSGKI